MPSLAAEGAPGTFDAGTGGQDANDTPLDHLHGEQVLPTSLQ